MAKRKAGVHRVKPNTKVTHYKLKREKTSDDKKPSYITKTGIKSPVCAQRRTSRTVVSGPSEGDSVLQNCSDRIVAAHVKIHGKPGVFIVPMCNNHNDSGGWGNLPPFPGDTVIVNGCYAVRVKDDDGRRGKTRTKSPNRKFRKLTKTKTLRLARSHGQEKWSWEGQRMGKTSNYKISRDTQRVSKK